MANLQVKNIPTALHKKLHLLARQRGTTVRELVLEAVRREVGREEFRRRLATRTAVDLSRPAARSIEEERTRRETELSR